MRRLTIARWVASAVIAILGGSLTTQSLLASVGATPDEIREKDQWVKRRLLAPDVAPPFSFVYGDQASGKLLETWTKKTETRKLDEARTEYSQTWTDPKTGLEVRSVAVDYSDFPTIEWTVYFKNTGKADTPILKDVQAIDTRVGKPKDKAVLHHNRGTNVAINDFEPLTTDIVTGKPLALVPGRGTSGGVWPYFNLQCGKGGRIIVIGWPGRWAIHFDRPAGKALRVTAGQELVHLKLRPGEEIRTPLMVQQFYNGDWQRAQNVWRRWMLAHNLPRPGGTLPPPQMTPCSSHQFAEMTKADEASQKLFIDRYLEEGLKIDYWWMDAGWYPCKGEWPITGTWEVDKTRFPNGLRAISDHAHKKGVKIIVWFEPERVAGGTWLADNHKDWLLGGTLLNLGKPEALKWAIQHFGDLIEAQGIDLYRQDYNIDPLPFLRNNDAPDRQGMTENAYTVGYLAYWDGLRKRFPNMLIDSCASGGHRNDLETMRRSVPLLRSDYIFEPVGQQGHTYGLAYWLPFFGTGEKDVGAYGFRSCMCAGNIPCWDVRDKKLNYDLLRKLTSEWREVADCYFGDFYPLTPYSLDPAGWMAWQFDVSEKGEGLVQAFRRDKNAEESKTFKLQGLDPDAVYTVKNFDVPDSTEMTGRDLSEKGLSINIKEKPGAAVISYKKKS